MNYSISSLLLSGPVADALGWTLLHAVWQGFVLVLLVAVGLYLLRNRSSALRYRVGVLTLLAQVLASVGTFFWYYQPTVALTSPLLASTPVRALPVRWQTLTQTLPWHQQVQQFLEVHLSQFVLVYLIGVAVFALRLAGGWLYLQRLSRTAGQPVSDQLTTLTQSLRSLMAIQPVVRIRESARIAVPMVVGVLKPVLLLPIGLAANLSIREVEAVLAHELAHVKRHDYAVNLLQSVVEVLYFFHPALWWLSERVREEREHCCDDLAVQIIGGDGRILAQALARVEELRLVQAATPALAMAFATKRQQLLHRVRRVLGVPTRPFVSNGSLAGITLATLLLISASVYAVQQEPHPKPKARASKPQSTRTFSGVTDGNRIEYGTTENRMTYVIFNGKPLPKAQVQRLQRQLDQVRAGQLNLDAVRQPDRDILLTIFEKSAGFEMGMAALSEGMAHIDYDNIVVSTLNKTPVSLDGTLAELEKINVNNTLESVGLRDVTMNHDSLDRLRALQQRRMDSLSQLMVQRSQQMQALHLQIEKLRFPVEELERAEQVLAWRKQKLLEQRNTLLEKHQRLLDNDGKQKMSVEEVEKQINALEPDIKKQEASIEALNKQLEELQVKQKDVRAPLEKLEREAGQLDREANKWSEQMSWEGEAFIDMTPDVNVNVNVDRRVGRPARAPRSPRPPKPAAVARPGTPVVPPAPVNVVRPATPAAPAVPPAPAASRPAPKPKVAPVPKP